MNSNEMSIDQLYEDAIGMLAEAEYTFINNILTITYLESIIEIIHELAKKDSNTYIINCGLIEVCQGNLPELCDISEYDAIDSVETLLEQVYMNIKL